MTASLRDARPEDAEEIIDLLHTHMKSSWTRERWARIFDNRWIDLDAPPPYLGCVAVNDSAIQGFCGVVCADRSIGGQRVRTGSITSLYLHRSLRGQGLGRELMVRASSRPELTYTVIGTGAGSRPLMEPSGYDLLDRDRFVWQRGDAGDEAGNVNVDTEAEAIRQKCDPNTARILDDHAGLQITPVWLETPEGSGFGAFWMQVQGEGHVYAHAVHIGAPSLFAAYSQDVANAILPIDGQATLAIDRRFLPPGTKGPMEDYGDVNFWKSPTLQREQVDLLYTEILLLKLKVS